MWTNKTYLIAISASVIILSVFLSFSSRLNQIFPLASYNMLPFADAAVKNSTKMGRLSPLDPSSFSRPELAKVTHLNFSLEVDFAKKIFSGFVDLSVEKVDPSVNEIILDTNDLIIESITDKSTKENLKFDLGEVIEDIGSKLTISLPNLGSNSYLINIKYKTSPSAAGLQWLSPEQTAGRKHPYVFSQFQAIAARSFVPCQDTPSVKTKYEAEITCPSELTVVMSAIRSNKTSAGSKSVYSFKQEVPVQSYLIAIAIGALVSKDIGPRSAVWAEKEVVEAAANEFAGTENQLKKAEEICGPYVWGRYDLLVLPPSFPFGGMENPCLTFVTPTLLAGDRSLANVIAHEIAHSWTGNLVSNANFEHFWMNEGFTVFVERKIIGRLAGAQMQDYQAYGGLIELRETINVLGKTSPITKLVVDLTNLTPDDAFSRVPYEKGHIFLRYLESTVGGPEVFEPFLRKYLEAFKYKSVTTDDFKKFFEKEFKAISAIESVDWDKWLYAPGMPPVIPDYDKSLVKVVEEKKIVFDAWDYAKANLPFDYNSLSSLQKIHLLQEIFEGDVVSVEKLKKFEETYDLDKVQNAEIKFRWLRIGIKAKWDKIVDPTINWLNEVGRMKYVRPLYRDLYAWEEVRPKAIENFEKNRKYMMHVAVSGVTKDLHLD